MLCARETAANRTQICPLQSMQPAGLGNYKPSPTLHCGKHPPQARGVCPGGLGSLKDGLPSTICLENGPAAEYGRVRVRVGLLQMPGRALLAERSPHAKVIMDIGACELSPGRLFHDPMDCSPSGSAVHGIFQARILEWVVISFFMGSSNPGIKPCFSRWILYHCTSWESWLSSA